MLSDMQLSTRSNEYWSDHILSAMDGLTKSYIFKLKLQNCEPIDLSRFVVTSGRDTWSTEHLILKLIQENTTANVLLITEVCSPYKKGSGHSFALYPSQIHVFQPAL
jgi:hypothetical protein